MEVCWSFPSLIFKEGAKVDPNNYWPISVLPVVSKLVERVVFKQLYGYLNYNNLLTESQSGFMPMFSTETSVLCTYQCKAGGGRGGGRRGMGWGFDIFQKFAVNFPAHGQIIPVKCNQISPPQAAHCYQIS